MIRIEVDMFSGRPNPVWILSPTRPPPNHSSIRSPSRPTSPPSRRRLHRSRIPRSCGVDLLGDDEARRKGVPSQFALASIAAKNLKRSGALAQRVIEAMPLRSEIRLAQHEFTPLDSRAARGGAGAAGRYLADPPLKIKPRPFPKNPLRTTIKDAACEQCQYEVSQFNPGFWNAPTVQPHNNCYNYGRNWRTDTFAQPGRAHGAQTNTMACNTVTTAAMADGLVKRCKCLPASEWPRRLMALVIDPGYGLSLVSSSARRLLGPQAGRDGGAQHRQQQRRDHQSRDLRSRRLHRLLRLLLRRRVGGHQLMAMSCRLGSTSSAAGRIPNGASTRPPPVRSGGASRR